MELCASPGAATSAAWTICRRPASRCGYTMPLAEIIFDFFDVTQIRTRGYASLDYEAGEQEADGEGRYPAAG